MDEDIKFLDDVPNKKDEVEDTSKNIKPPEWSIEPPLEIERSEDEL